MFCLWRGCVADQKVGDLKVNKIFYKFFWLGIIIKALSFSDENDSWDEYFSEKNEIIICEGHWWHAHCLEHSNQCPCRYENDNE